MIYKFKTQNSNSFVEVQKDGDNAKITLFDDEDIFVVEITKETLYDFIGALHSIKGKIEKGANNG